MKKLLPLFLLATLSGCDLGEGSKLESLEIVTASGATITGSHQMHPCFRDRLNVLGRFTDGTVGNFSTRATWSSSNDAVVRALKSSELNTRAVFSNDGGVTIGFNDINGLFYTAGTLVPKGVGAATVTASFLGLSVSVPVTVTAPTTLAVSASPITGSAVATSAATGVGFVNQFTVQAVMGGQTIDAISRRQDPGTLELLNPILWQFTDNSPTSFSAGRSASTSSLDQLNLNLFPNNSSRTTTDPVFTGTQAATLGPDSGVLRTVSPSTPEIQAIFDTTGAAGVAACPAVTTLSAPVKTLVSLTLDHEKNFNGDGIVPNGDLVIRTEELLKTTANLGGADTQDVSTQVGYEVIESDRDLCITGSACTVADHTRVSSILQFSFSRMFPVSTTGSFVTNTTIVPVDPRFDATLTDVDTVNIRACFPRSCNTGNTICKCDTATSNSNMLAIRAVPAVLTASSNISILPFGPAPQPAFTFPGQKFDTYATFIASTNLATNNFSGNNAIATQNVSRLMDWAARKPADATFSDLATIFTGGASNSGEVYYRRLPTGASENVNITATPSSVLLSGFPNAPTPAAVTLTVTP